MKYSDNDIENVRRLDIIDFLSRYEGFSFHRAGRGYRCDEHNSLYIYPDRCGWHWNSQDKWGSSVIDYCQKMKGMSFPDTIKMFLGENTIEIPKASIAVEKTVEKPFSLPEKTQGKASRMFAYLNITRKIDNNVILALKNQKKLYQDAKGNVVFVGYDEENKARYACTRGTYSDVQYRGEIEGSKKEYSFSVDGSNKNKLYVFESPIDLMSHCTLANMIINNDKAWTVHNRLSLGGTSEVALEHYLSKHTEVSDIIFCLDNDTAGRKATDKYIQKYSEKGYSCSAAFPKQKDYNEELVTFCENNKKDTINKNNTSASL